MKSATAAIDHTPVLRTPDDRYIVVRGRLWRAANPHLSAELTTQHIAELMTARRNLKGNGSTESRAAARQAVHAAKVALGERGPVWWTDGAPDWNRHLARLSPYSDWYANHLETQSDSPS